MARLNRRAPSSDLEHDNSPSSSENRQQAGSETPPSDFESNSDKENRGHSKSKQQSVHKRKGITVPMAGRDESSVHANKRRRTETQNGRISHVGTGDGIDRKVFDPDQDLEEVRKSRKSYRDLETRVNESRKEFLQANSKGLEQAVLEADQLFRGVKQTSVAVIDSRLLVSIGDLANKKVKTLTLGDSSTGVDVDDFVTKCIFFMKRGQPAHEDDPVSTQSTQHQQRRRRNQTNDADEDEDSDEPMNWAHLGKNACLLYNSRPSVPGFLLGPLSVQKKVRQQTQRRVRQTQVDPSQAARPRELAAEDLEKQESANLTVTCGEIARLLDQVISQGTQLIEEEYESFTEEPSPDQVRDLLAKHGLSDNTCVPLFNFCVNPKSFGQTVENMFYVSFLIKEGKVGLDFDSDGLPTLGTADAKTVAERQETQRNQAVFTLDFDMWEELVESFGITESIIPHREEEEWDDGTLQEVARAVGVDRALDELDDDDDNDDDE